MPEFDTMFTSGTRAAQPAAAAADQQFYMVTDEANKIERSNGAAWSQWGPIGLIDYKSFRMTAAQGFTSNTTFANITSMGYAIGANERWFSDFYLLVTGARAGQLKYAFTYPAAATIEIASMGPASGFGTTGSDIVEGALRTQQIIGVASGVIAGIIGCGDNTANALMAHIRATIQNGANAGTVQLQAAQNASSATVTNINIGSSFEAKRFA